MDCKIMQKSLKTLRFKRKMQTTPKTARKSTTFMQSSIGFYLFFRLIKIDMNWILIYLAPMFVI